jgi:hypothetical protein
VTEARGEFGNPEEEVSALGNRYQRTGEDMAD